MSVKISQLPAGTTPTGAELIPAVQGGVTVSLLESQISLSSLVSTGVAMSAVDSGAANAYVLTSTKPVGSLQTGQLITFHPQHANTGPSTVSFNGGGALALIDSAGNALTEGQVIAQQLGIVWTGSEFELLWDLPLANRRTAAETAASAVVTNYTYPPGDVRRYGADPTGSANSSAAFATAFAVKGLITAVGNFLLNTGVTLDIATTSLIGPCKLTSGLAANAGSFLTIVSSSASVEDNAKNVISQVRFQGTGVTGVQGMNFAGGADAVCTFAVNSCVLNDFADGAWINTNSFEINFHSCSFSNCGSDHAALWAHFGSTERVSLVQCQLYNNTECVRVDGGGEVFLDNCSLDYSNRLINAAFGNVYATNCYYENGSTVGDLDYWFKAAANDSTIVLQGGQISQTITKTAFAIGQSLATYGGGIFFRNVKFFSNTNGIVNPIIAGSGNAFASGCMIDGFSNNQVAWANFSAAQNLCSNGTFANGGAGVAFAGWTVVTGAGTESPTTSANTLLMQVTTGGDSIALYWTVAAEPGQNVGFTCMMKGNTSACQFGMILSAVGADGVVIASSIPQETFNEFNGSTSPCPTAYTSVRAILFNCPPGTATVQAQLNTLGATSNSHLVSVQSVLVGKY